MILSLILEAFWGPGLLTFCFLVAPVTNACMFFGSQLTSLIFACAKEAETAMEEQMGTSAPGVRDQLYIGIYIYIARYTPDYRKSYINTHHELPNLIVDSFYSHQNVVWAKRVSLPQTQNNELVQLRDEDSFSTYL